jgi:hypothetical protein
MASTSPRPTDPADLQNAVEDSHYLLAYFSRKKVDIPDGKRNDFNKWVKILSSFRAALTDGIAEFWEAFIGLSDLAYPATIESIRYYFSDDKTRSHFATMTLIALIMTIGLSLLSYCVFR